MTRIRNSAPVDPNDRFAQQIKGLLQRVADLERKPAATATTPVVPGVTWHANVNAGASSVSVDRTPRGMWVCSFDVTFTGAVAAFTAFVTLPVGYRYSGAVVGAARDVSGAGGFAAVQSAAGAGTLTLAAGAVAAQRWIGSINGRSA